MRAACITSAVLFLAALAVTADSTDIARWAEQLGDPKLEIRENAWKELLRAGPAAEGELRRTLNGPDSRSAIRAAQLLERLEWKIPADAPGEMVELLGKLRANPNVDAEDVQKLIEFGPQAIPALTHLVIKTRDIEDCEASPQQGQNPQVIMLIYAAHFPLLALGQPLALERLYEESLQSTSAVERSQSLIQDYCALADSMGRLPELRSRWQHPPFNQLPVAQAVRMQLAYLAGDLAAARELAETPDLANELAWRLEDWPALLEQLDEQSFDDHFDTALRAALSRRANKSDGLTPKQFRLIRKAITDGVRPPDQAFMLTVSSLLGRHPEMMREWRANSRKRLAGLMVDRSVGVEWLPLQLDFKAAMNQRWNGGLFRQNPSEAFANEAKMMADLGDFDLARSVFTFQSAQSENHYVDTVVRSTTELSHLGDVATARELTLDRMVRLERMQHALPGAVVNSVLNIISLRNLFDSCFHDQGDVAEVWWHYFVDARPTREHSAHMESVADVLDPIRPLRPDLAQVVESLLNSKSDRFPRAMIEAAAAAAWMKAGDRIRAAEHLRSAAVASHGMDDWQKYLVFLANQGLPPSPGDTARLLSDLPYLPQLQIAMAFLERRAGRTPSADELARRANSMLDGDPDAQWASLEFLMKVGDFATMRSLAHKSLRTSHLSHRPQIYGYLEADALLHGDFRAALDLAERHLIVRLQLHDEPQISESLFLAAHLHMLRARVALEDDRFDEAMSHARHSMDLVSSQSSIIRVLVPELMRRNRPAEANEIYERIVSAHRAVLKDWPDSHMAKSGLARVMAGARRDLDEALTLAQSAVDVVPHQSIYWEALAEVQLQRGDLPAARANARKAERFEPRQCYFTMQRQRVERGDPNSPLPSQAVWSVLAP